MAEFQEVMRQWARMCSNVPGKSKGNLCSDVYSGYVCPLREKGLCNQPISSQTNSDRVIGEKIIMAWAAEHPEPVYPTWFEWLKTVVSDEEMLQRGMYWDMQIPADIAQKLGLQPKTE